MTLQVALQGRDGFVIASDRKNLAKDEKNISPRWIAQTGETGKILVSKDEDLVCAFAIHESYSAIARDVIAKPLPNLQSDGDVYAYFCQTVRAEIEASPDWPSRACKPLIFGLPKADPKIPKLWQMIVHPGPLVTAAPCPLRAYAGNGDNAAIYFVERFQPVGLLEKQPVDELIGIAVHTVLEGAQLNRYGIGGIDVLLCKDGHSPDFIAAAKLKTISNCSLELSTHVAQQLLHLSGEP